MSDQTQPPPPPPDPEQKRQRDIQRLAVDALRYALPPPIEDTPENRTIRDLAAVAKVCCMLPADPVEVDLACSHVACLAQHLDCLRQASEHDTCNNPDGAKQCRAQAASMGREARGSLGKFERLQAVRKKREADPLARDDADRAEHGMLGLMTQALESLPPQAPPRPPPPAPAGEKRAQQPKWPPLRDYDDWTPEEKAAEKLRGEAGRYALLNPTRVQIIRKLGGLPPDCDYEPPRAEVLHEIIHGNGSNVRWAETYVPYVMPPPEG